jgi:zinc transport system substrate-binding protein
MRRTLTIVLLLAMIACGRERKEQEKPVVAVSILPLRYLVTSIADTLVDVMVMVPPGAAPETWEPTAAQMLMLEKAELSFTIGYLNFEDMLLPGGEAKGRGPEVVTLSDGLDLIGMEYRHGDHTHRGVDPHIWMSPLLMEQMAGRVYEELLLILPGRESLLQQRHEKLVAEIRETSRYAEKELAGFKDRPFFIFHPALGYFARDYGLVQLSVEYEGKEPSPAYLKELIGLARTANAGIIFIQEEFDVRNATVIANEIGGEVVRINPLSGKWPQEIRNITDHLKNSFRP